MDKHPGLGDELGHCILHVGEGERDFIGLFFRGDPFHGLLHHGLAPRCQERTGLLDIRVLIRIGGHRVLELLQRVPQGKGVIRRLF